MLPEVLALPWAAAPKTCAQKTPRLPCPAARDPPCCSERASSARASGVAAQTGRPVHRHGSLMLLHQAYGVVRVAADAAHGARQSERGMAVFTRRIAVNAEADRKLQAVAQRS